MIEREISCAKSLGDVSNLVATCNRCELSKTKIHDVPGSGNPKAKIVFIGEAPGKKEDETGEPFVGAAGKFLDELLSSINLSRDDIFISSVIKHRPPKNRDPKPNEIKACWPFLERQIEIIKPKLIVLLGKHSLNQFFPEAKISEVHGQILTRNFSGEKMKFLALYHPAAALYKGSLRETLKKDFLNIMKTIN